MIRTFCTSSSSGMLELLSSKRAQWRKRVTASSWTSGFKIHCVPKLENATLEVTKILYSGIWTLNFSTRASEPGQTSSRTNNTELLPICLSKSPNWLTASSSLWKSGTWHPQCSNNLSTIIFSWGVFEKVTNKIFSPNLPRCETKEICKHRVFDVLDYLECIIYMIFSRLWAYIATE